MSSNMNHRPISDQDAYFAELVLGAIQNLEVPMLMYEPEKVAVKHALEIMLEMWSEEKAMANDL